MGSETGVKVEVGRRKSYSELYARILELEQKLEEKDEEIDVLRIKVERQQTLLSHRMQCITQLQMERGELRKQNSELIAKMAEVTRRNSISGSSPPMSFRRRRATPPPITIMGSSPSVARRVTELPPIPSSPAAEETSPPEKCSPSPERTSSPNQLTPPLDTNKDSETDYSDMEDEISKPAKPNQLKKPEKDKKEDDKGAKKEATKEDDSKKRDEKPSSDNSWIHLQPGGTPQRRSGSQTLQVNLSYQPPPTISTPSQAVHAPLRRLSGSRSPSPDYVPDSNPALGQGGTTTAKPPPVSNSLTVSGKQKKSTKKEKGTKKESIKKESAKKESAKKESTRKGRSKSPRPNSVSKKTESLGLLPNGNVPHDQGQKAGWKKSAAAAQRESISDIVLTWNENDPKLNQKESDVLSAIKELSGPEAASVSTSFNFELDSSTEVCSPLLSPESGAVKQTSPPPEITGSTDGSSGPSQAKKNERVVMFNPTADEKWKSLQNHEEEEGDIDEDGDRLSKFRSRTQTVGAFGEHKELGRQKYKRTKKGPNRKLRRQSSFSDYRHDRTIQIQGLELFSPDVEARIRAKVCRAIEVKYGGQSTQAAISIQRAYRDYKLKKRFEEIRREASQMRKRAESLRVDPKRRPSIVRKRRELNGKDPLLLAREASKKLANRHGGYNSVRKQLVRQSLAEFPLVESAVEITGDMETAVCEVPIGYDSDSEEKHSKLKFQLSGATLGETSTDPSKEAGKPSAFSSDKLYRHHRPSIFSTSVSSDNLEELRQQVERERGVKRRKYSQATIKQKTSVGINHFNRKPTRGIQYLVLESVVEDDPRSVAEFLLNQYGLSKEKIGEFLGEINKEFNMAVLECLVEMVDLKEKPIDDALRQFQEIFRMPGEAQKIDKIMQAFALEYYRNNPEGAIKSEDGAYMLSFAIMMLHTSLHNPSVRHRTTTQQWVSMNRGCNDGENFPEQFLLDIYARIKKTEFATGLDHTHVVAQIERQIVGSTLAKLAIPQRHFIYKVSVTEVLDVNVRQGNRARHRRVLFLFSDLVVVCKRKSSDQYIFRESFSLLNALGLTFDTEYYKHGIQIYSSLDKKAIFYCNCDSATDRTEFLAKFDETIAELCEMETDRIAELGNSFGKKTKESTGARHRHMSRAGDLLSTTNLSGSYNVRSKEKDGKDFVRGVGDIAVSTSLSQGLLKGTAKSRNRSSGDSGFDSQQTTPVASPSPIGKSQAQAAVLKSPKIALTQPQTPTPPPPTSPTVLNTPLTVSSVATPPRSRSSDHLRSLTITPSSAGLLALPPRAHSVDKDDTDGTGVRPRRGSAADADVRNLRTSEQEEKKPGKRRGKFPSIPSPFRKRSESRKAGADARVKRTVSQSPPRRENFEVNNRAKSQSPPVPRKTEDGRPISNPDFTTFSHET